MPAVRRRSRPFRAEVSPAGESYCAATARRASVQRFDVVHLDVQHGALNAVHAVIVAGDDVVVFGLLPPIAEQRNSSREFRVVGDHRPALAVCAEILAGIEAEAAEIADGSGAAALVLRAVSLRRVLDDDEPVAAAISMIGSMSAIRPCRCTGMIALVRGVIAASISAGSIVQVTGSTSTKTGLRAGSTESRRSWRRTSSRR